MAHDFHSPSPAVASTMTQLPHLTHLRQLEAESIHIMREVASEFQNPVMLYSIGKDSSVMLHLAKKAFYPSAPPFPLMHVDTTLEVPGDVCHSGITWPKTSAWISSCTSTRTQLPRGSGPSPTARPSHTDVMKTQSLKQALDKYGFDAAFGGARRDEEKVPRQGARLFFPHQDPPLGPQEPAARSSGVTTTRA